MFLQLTLIQQWHDLGEGVFAEQPLRLRHVGSLMAVCLPLGGLVKDPEARPRGKTAKCVWCSYVSTST
jgi:hypothetical protein